jgi:hypothetical protein
MESLADLIVLYAAESRKQVPDGETIQSLSLAIKTHYGEPESLDQIIAVLSSPDALDIVKSYAALGLRSVFRLNKDTLLAPGALKDRLPAFVEILRAGPSPDIVRHLVMGLDPVFEVEGEQWEGMIELGMEFSTSGSVPQMSTGMEVLAGLLPQCSSDAVQARADALFWIADASLDHPSLTVLGFEIFALIVRGIDGAFPDAVFPFFNRLLEVFGQLLAGGTPREQDLARASNSIRSCLKTEELFGPPAEIIDGLLSVARLDVAPRNRSLTLYPIKTFLAYHGHQCDAEHLSAIAQVVIEISAQQFHSNDGFEDNEYARAPADIFERISERANNNDFLTYLLGIPSEEPAESFAVLCALMGSIDFLSPFMELRFGELMEYCQPRIAGAQCPAVAQAVLCLMQTLADAVPAAMLAYGDALMDMAFGSIEQGDEELTYRALKFVSSFLHNVELDATATLAVVPRLLALAEQFGEDPRMLTAVLLALSAAIASLGEDAERVPSDVFAAAWTIVQAEDAPSELRGSAISLVGRFVSANVDDSFGEVVAAILECSDPKSDDVELRWAAFDALKVLYRRQPRAMLELTGAMQGSFLAALTTLGFGEEENPSEVTKSDLICEAFDLLRAVMATGPECAATFGGGVHSLHRWGSSAFPDFMKNAGDEAIAQRAIRAGFTFYCLMRSLKWDFPYFDTVAEIIANRGDPSTVAVCLRSFQKLVNIDPDAAVPLLADFVEFALGGIRRTLHCQIRQGGDPSFDWDADLSGAIYDVISDSILKYGRAAFPMGGVIEACGEVLEKLDAIEQFAVIGVLANWVQVGGDLPSDFIEFALSKLTECDFSISPDPVFFARVLIAQKPHMIAKDVPRIIEFMGQKLVADQSCGRFYWETVTNVIAAVFAAAGNGMLDIAELIAPILAKLPVRGDLDEALYIYGRLLQMAEDCTETLEPHAPEVFRVVVETLAQTERWFSKSHIDGETRARLVSLFHALAGQMRDAEAAAGQILGGDQLKIERLTGRVATPLQ